MTNATPPWIVKPLVAEEVYTDRAEFLEYFYRDALRDPPRIFQSLGQKLPTLPTSEQIE